MEFKRDKEIPSKTFHIETNACGTLHLTLGFQDEKLVEVRAMIGKTGICCNILVESICKILSMFLQTETPRYKIVKKIRKQFLETAKFPGVNCGQGIIWENKSFGSCVDLIGSSVVAELEKQIS